MKGRTESTPAASSFRDPSGFIFTREGVLYRQVNASYREDYDALMGSGLYQALVERQLLLPHEETAMPAPQADIAYKVIKPERIGFISYPYEWCFGQLRDAARTTLQIQKLAIARGMSLKDASAYNIQFHRGKPILIDSLSFERLREGEPWIAYRQFCQHFLSPLALMALCDVRLGQWARVDIDGVPLDLASRLLPWRTRLSFPLLVHIHMHARAQRRYAEARVAEERGARRMGKQALLGLVESLQGAVRRLSWNSGDTPWADYAHDHTYGPKALEAKRVIVSEWLARLQPSSVWDLGANVGEFSRLASEQGFPTIAFDYDHGAVEQNYQRCLAEEDTHILPLVLDLANPSPAIGWSNQERLSLKERSPTEAMMALALIHHLAISNNVPLRSLASFFASLGKWLILEFVPKSDSQVQRLLANREDIFPDYHPEGFEDAFRSYFRIEDKRPLPDSERQLYLMESTA